MYICRKCSLGFNNEFDFNQHNSSKHPLDDYQLRWSKINNWDNYSLAYRDDPYY